MMKGSGFFKSSSIGIIEIKVVSQLDFHSEFASLVLGGEGKKDFEIGYK